MLNYNLYIIVPADAQFVCVVLALRQSHNIMAKMQFFMQTLLKCNLISYCLRTVKCTFFVMVKEMNFNFVSPITLMTHKWPKKPKTLITFFYIYVCLKLLCFFYIKKLNAVVISSKMVALPLGIMFLDTKLTVCFLYIFINILLDIVF